MVEQRIENPRVSGSIPLQATIFKGSAAENVLPNSVARFGGFSCVKFIGYLMSRPPSKPAENDFDEAKNFFLLGLENYQNEQYEEAERLLLLSLELLPDRLSTLTNLSAVLIKQKKFEKANKIISRAVELFPSDEIIHLNQGVLYEENKNWQMALSSYDKAIELKHDYPEAYFNRGNVLKDLKRFNEALTSYEATIELNPDYEYLLGTLLHTKMLICNWQDFETNVKKLTLKINDEKKVTPSFSVLALTDSLTIQRNASETWINHKYSLNRSLGSVFKYSRKNKIRIGYYSADFREHPVSYLTAQFFEKHDKNNFQLIGFYFGPKDFSNMHKRIISAFDEFIDVQLKSDKDIAQLSREMEIDIAIDLTGMTEHERIGVFSYRAAPIQISYIGYLGTMGAEYYDYLIADKTIIPIESQQYYREKIVYLPSYQVNDSKREIANKIFIKSELNLPENRFVFCCFNNNYKITPPTFDGWMRILKAVPDSVLFLYAGNKWAEANLKLEAEKRGVSNTQLVFGTRIGRSEYLARYRAADLFLDTLPYNAGTTASDALWAGLPVLTCMGESFASRVAASLLNAIELPELITTTQEQYEATAIELATNPAKLKQIKDKLERNRLTTALFDTPGFTKHIEAAYTQIYERYQADLPPDNIYIEN